MRVGETLPDDLGIRSKEIQRALRSSGWPRACVKIFTETVQQKEFKIYVDVEKGYRRRIGRIKLVRVPKELQSKIRRKLRRKKIFVSATLTIDKLQTAKDDILDVLYEEGYLNARVQILTDTGNNTSQVEIICETGPKTIFELSGEGLPRGQKLLDTLEIYRGDLISQYDVKRYEEKLHQYFFDRGYAEAKNIHYY